MLRSFVAMLTLALLVPVSAAAQDFGVMNSAETINKGNFKLMANPLVVFGNDNADDEFGVAVVGGYGFTDRVDAEAKVSFFDDLTFIGGDVEVWILKNQPLDLSVIGGFHVGLAEGRDAAGFDITFLGSKHVLPKLEIYGGLDIATNDFEDSDDHFTTVHLVPGIEYAISRDIDLVAEVGLGLNDDARHYISGGIAFYIR
jgi:outer membrane protein with beta-barrel domain